MPRFYMNPRCGHGWDVSAPWVRYHSSRMDPGFHSLVVVNDIAPLPPPTPPDPLRLWWVILALHSGGDDGGAVDVL
nr:uncharacterized protein CTRU02_14824 [Colletotrichum truncatum]KAF6781727.1 hypothetical protein CTRU02_14824 [Colletotrichum truncatum]